MCFIIALWINFDQKEAMEYCKIVCYEHSLSRSLAIRFDVAYQ